MSTLLEALRKATVSLEEQVTKDALKKAESLTREVTSELNDSYGDFFHNLSTYVLNDKGANAADSYLPRIFSTSGVAMPKWKAVSPRWFEQKEKAAKKGDPQALQFYHGVTTAAVQATRDRKGRFKKRSARSRFPFSLYIQSLEMGGLETVEGLFGKMKVNYSVIRPDKGVVKLQNLDGAIKVIQQRRPTGQGNKSVIAGFLDGTVIRTEITAFPSLAGLNNEKQIVQKLAVITGDKDQWRKVTGTGKPNHPVRPVILPLINWYLKVNFRLMLEERFR